VTPAAHASRRWPRTRLCVGRSMRLVGRLRHPPVVVRLHANRAIESPRRMADSGRTLQVTCNRRHGYSAAR